MSRHCGTIKIANFAGTTSRVCSKIYVIIISDVKFPLTEKILVILVPIKLKNWRSLGGAIKLSFDSTISY